MNRIFLGVLPLVMALLTTGCYKGWQLDYGTPAAHFLAPDLAARGQPYVGKLIVVKGTVTRVDVSDPKSARAYLEGNVECNFGRHHGLETRAEIGETVFLRGFLKRCEPGDVLIQPLSFRDPKAPFSPE